MKFLFIHQNFPGQFLHLSRELVNRNHEVVALTLNNRELPSDWFGVKVINYSLNVGNGRDTFQLAIDFESKTIRAAACYSKALELKSAGYSPDVIISHPGWGESLFIKQVWPKSILKIYCEFYYSISGQDVGFDPEFEPDHQYYLPGVLLKNSNILLHAEQSDACISPTHWQASTFPDFVRSKISVIHDGIDTDLVKSDDTAKLALPGGRQVSGNDEVITFVSRALEPYRGFHVFMRSLPKLLRSREKAIVLIVGQEGISYGSIPPKGHSWKSLFLDEIRPRLSTQEYERIFFLDNVPYETFKQVLCVSTTHIYLTYPFVLSWSLLEAMASGCAIVASKTAPVEEVIIDDETGSLVDFFDPECLSEAIEELVKNPEKRARLGMKAREYVQENFDLKRKCLPEQVVWAELS